MRTALVIDDIKSNRIFMEKCLREEGFSVVSTYNGIDALKLMEKQTFDIVFMDMRLPSMSGMQILKCMKEKLIDIPVAVVTAFGTVNNAIECLDNGVIAYIRKPLSVERFKKCIADINRKLDNLRHKGFLQKVLDINENNKTKYASAEKLADETIYQQAEIIHRNKSLTDLFNIIPNTVLILNNERQIIYSNSYFLEMIAVNNEAPIGLRPGEILNCVHAYKDTNGCGTMECCSLCGSVQAIIQTQRTKKATQRECLMNYKDGDVIISRELLISVTPADHILEGATIFIVKDISSEKFKTNMERIFFHDLLNTSGSIKCMAECAEKADEMHEMQRYVSHINESTDFMIDEIMSQRLLLSAEKNEVQLDVSEVSLSNAINSIIKHYIDYECEIAFEARDIIVISDEVLITRVVANMVKNAVEASSKTITISITDYETYVDISVHNEGYMSKEVQLQVFKKFFSTKGSGRGIGTYGMKLIGEGSLKGKVWFESNADVGTTFIFRVPHCLPE